MYFTHLDRVACYILLFNFPQKIDSVAYFKKNQFLGLCHFSQSRKYQGKILLVNRPVVPGCAMAHPDFGRSVNPISTRGDRLCPLNYYWHTQIFRPSDGPGMTSVRFNFFMNGSDVSFQFTTS